MRCTLSTYVVTLKLISPLSHAPHVLSTIDDHPSRRESEPSDAPSTHINGVCQSKFDLWPLPFLAWVVGMCQCPDNDDIHVSMSASTSTSAITNRSDVILQYSELPPHNCSRNRRRLRARHAAGFEILRAEPAGRTRCHTYFITTKNGFPYVSIHVELRRKKQYTCFQVSTVQYRAHGGRVAIITAAPKSSAWKLKTPLANRSPSIF